MDIPLPDSVTFYARTGENRFGPEYDSTGVSTNALAQGVSQRITFPDGEEEQADLLVFLPPAFSVAVGDKCVYAGRVYSVLKVEYLSVNGIGNHIEVFAKSRPDESVPPEPPEPVAFEIYFGEAASAPYISPGEPLMFTAQDSGRYTYPEIELFINGSWEPAEGEIYNGTLFLFYVDDSAVPAQDMGLEHVQYRILTQPAGIVTPLALPKSGTIERPQ